MLSETQESKLIGIIKKNMADKTETAGGTGYRYFHQLRVYNSCKKFLRIKSIKEKVMDEDAVLVAALFHDIGRVGYYTDEPSDATMPGHDKKSSAMIKGLLKGVLDKQTIDRAARLIRGGESNDKGMEFEIELLNEADSLDEGGLLNVWRMFSFSAHHRRTIDGVLDYYKVIETKRRKGEWLSKFRIPEIRKVAERRNSEMDNTMKEFEKEHTGRDIL